ncbi:MAG: hypothetical protein H7330_11260 [Hymenobacteraceae bacterium]|nr:hypothetical protein [Hymenobacteraceae bacterium]
MNTNQEDRATMYETVVRFLGPDGLGEPLGQIKLIGTWRGKLDGVAQQIRQEAQRQGKLSEVTTRTRLEVKRAAAAQAEVLRNLLLVLSEDAALLATLEAQSAREACGGDDVQYLVYLRAVIAGIGAVPPAELADAGYEAAVLAALEEDVAALEKTTGATRDILIETAAATDTLPNLFAEATAILEQKLDRLVEGQRRSATLGALVPEYEKARRIVHTTAQRRPLTLRGATRFDAPVVAADRSTLPGTDLLLGNRSAKGVSLLYYLADTPDARPAVGQGVVVKRNAEAHLGPDTVAKLGDVRGRYLLVIQRQMAADGQFWVRG